MQATTRRTILIVDDQASVRLSLAYLLELPAYRTIVAESGLAAIAAAETEPIDGALIDLHMPGMDGFDTASRLQAQARALGRPLKLWFMSGTFNARLERRARELGALGLLRKPFDHAALLSQLEQGFTATRPPTSPDAASDDNTPVAAGLRACQPATIEPNAGRPGALPPPEPPGPPGPVETTKRPE